MSGIAIITEACIDVKDRACVDVCPVQCIYEFDPENNVLFSEVQAGNGEIARLHQEVTERIRIVRRLDFTNPDRATKTYEEHQAILDDLLEGRVDSACTRLEAHIASSRAAVETITNAKLEAARSLRYGG